MFQKIPLVVELQNKNGEGHDTEDGHTGSHLPGLRVYGDRLTNPDIHGRAWSGARHLLRGTAEQKRTSLSLDHKMPSFRCITLMEILSFMSAVN
jgi:hypothetical protein